MTCSGHGISENQRSKEAKDVLPHKLQQATIEKEGGIVLKNRQVSVHRSCLVYDNPDESGAASSRSCNGEC
jgi:hypothetical protein